MGPTKEEGGDSNVLLKRYQLYGPFLIFCFYRFENQQNSNFMEKSLDLCSRPRFQLKKCARRRHLPEDRISSLPDDILMIILSFLTFEEVIRTSLLSRRWLNVWVHTPVLDFHVPLPKAMVLNNRERRNFVKWVNRVLWRHKCDFLKEFKIVCDLDKRNQKHIDRWLAFALEKKVQSLELYLLYTGCAPANLDDNYVFPGRFLNSSTGKATLDVGMSRVLQFDFKCLRLLSLKSVDVTGEDINLFLLKCPLLERIEVVGSPKLVELVISDPTLVLKYLQIKFCFNLEVLSISNFNLISLDIPSVGDLTLKDLPMLVVLSISGISERLSRFFPRVSPCYSQLECLTLKEFKLKDLPELSNLGQLTKLKRLVLNFGSVGDESLTLLISIINCFPHLEEFVLMLYYGKPERTGIPISDVERGGSSLKNQSLKVFEFMGYCGRVIDVEFIMHVVENAVGLEEVVIDPRIITSIFPRTPIKKEKKARRIALEQFDSLREAIPPHVRLLIR